MFWQAWNSIPALHQWTCNNQLKWSCLQLESENDGEDHPQLPIAVFVSISKVNSGQDRRPLETKYQPVQTNPWLVIMYRLSSSERSTVGHHILGQSRPIYISKVLDGFKPPCDFWHTAKPCFITTALLDSTTSFVKEEVAWTITLRKCFEVSGGLVGLEWQAYFFQHVWDICLASDATAHGERKKLCQGNISPPSEFKKQKFQPKCFQDLQNNQELSLSQFPTQFSFCPHRFQRHKCTINSGFNS